jgi:hypothetical protein
MHSINNHQTQEKGDNKMDQEKYVYLISSVVTGKRQILFGIWTVPLISL